MRKLLMAKILSLCLVGTAWAQIGTVGKLADAIARTEGFQVAGTLPARLHNPGDIRSRLPHAYAGQVGLYHGYVVFRTDRAGWAALYAQIQRVIDGTSAQYDQSMTFAQIAKVYAADPRWKKTVCKILEISPATTFQEYFGLAPRVRVTWNSNADILKHILAPIVVRVALADTSTSNGRTDGGDDAQI